MLSEPDPEKTRKWEVMSTTGHMMCEWMTSAPQEKERKKQMKKSQPRMKQMKVRG